MICAALAGIEVFVTGGIGGVHRGRPRPSTSRPTCRSWRRPRWRWSVPGAKSILDIGLTLEYLETHGVPVLSCGQDNFAAFYTRDSGFRADFRLDDRRAGALHPRQVGPGPRGRRGAEHAGARSGGDAARGDRCDHGRRSPRPRGRASPARP
jgi:hypothetical protein